MKQTRRNSILILTIIICAGIPISLGIVRFWERQFEPVTFHFHYENFEGFACTTWTGYQSKTQSLTLSNGMTMITCTEDSYLSPLALDISFTSTASGAEVTCSGQYVRLFYAATVQVIEDVGDPFIMLCDGTPFSLDTSDIEWADCSVPSTIGYALELTFTIQTGGITETETGDYTYTVSVGIGVE